MRSCSTPWICTIRTAIRCVRVAHLGPPCFPSHLFSLDFGVAMYGVAECRGKGCPPHKTRDLGDGDLPAPASPPSTQRPEPPPVLSVPRLMGPEGQVRGSSAGHGAHMHDHGGSCRGKEV